MFLVCASLKNRSSSMMKTCSLLLLSVDFSKYSERGNFRSIVAPSPHPGALRCVFFSRAIGSKLVLQTRSRQPQFRESAAFTSTRTILCCQSMEIQGSSAVWGLPFLSANHYVQHFSANYLYQKFSTTASQSHVSLKYLIISEDADAKNKLHLSLADMHCSPKSTGCAIIETCFLRY